MPDVMHLLRKTDAKVTVTRCGLSIPTKTAKDCTTIWWDERVTCDQCNPYTWVDAEPVGKKMVLKSEVDMEARVVIYEPKKAEVEAPKKILRRRTTPEPETKVVRRRRMT